MKKHTMVVNKDRYFALEATTHGSQYMPIFTKLAEFRLIHIKPTKMGFLKMGFLKMGFLKMGFFKMGFFKMGFFKMGFFKMGFFNKRYQTNCDCYVCKFLRLKI